MCVYSNNMSQDYGENLIVGGEYKKEKCMWRLSLCIVLIYFIWKQSTVNKRSFSVDLSHVLNLLNAEWLFNGWSTRPPILMFLSSHQQKLVVKQARKSYPTRQPKSNKAFYLPIKLVKINNFKSPKFEKLTPTSFILMSYRAWLCEAELCADLNLFNFVPSFWTDFAETYCCTFRFTSLF